MTRDYVECPEVAGKTIKALKLYEDDTDGCETLIEFTDGTSFSSFVSYQPTFKANIVRGRRWDAEDHPRLRAAEPAFNPTSSCP